jgi:hypothetical protein
LRGRIVRLFPNECEGRGDETRTETLEPTTDPHAALANTNPETQGPRAETAREDAHTHAQIVRSGAAGRAANRSKAKPQATGRYRARPPGDPRRYGPPRDATTILNQAELSGLASASCKKTELVALGIGEDHPSLLALPNIDFVCAEVEQPR